MLGCVAVGTIGSPDAGGNGVSLVRPKDEGERWVKLVLVTMGIWVALFITMAVIPSYWLYFADGTLKWTGRLTIPYGFGELDLPQQALRDLIVVVWYGVALGGCGVGILVYKQRKP